MSLWATFFSGLALLAIVFVPALIVDHRDFAAWCRDFWRSLR